MGLGAAAAGAIGLSEGLGATLVAGAVDAGIGAGLGAGEAALTGGDPGKGALGGAISGGVLGGFGGPVGDAIGSPFWGDVLTGAAGGALGSGATGGNPLVGAATGAVSGGVAGAFAPSAGGAGVEGGGGTSAASFTGDINAPGFSSDLTSVSAPITPVESAPLGDAGASTFTSPVTTLTGNVNAPLLDSSDSVFPAGTIQGPTPSGATLDAVPPPQVQGPMPDGLTVADSQFADKLTNAPNTIGSSATTPTILSKDGSNALSLARGNVDAGKSSGGFFDNALKDVTEHPVAATVAGGGLLMSLLNGQGTSGKINSQLQAEAGGLANQGQQLASYLQTGTLPPGVKTSIDQATAAAKAAVKSNFAARGLAGSTMEQQALQQIDLNAVGKTTQIAEGLLSQGINEQQIASSLLQGVLTANTAQSRNTGQSIASLAAALSGGNTRQQQTA